MSSLPLGPNRRNPEPRPVPSFLARIVALLAMTLLVPTPLLLTSAAAQDRASQGVTPAPNAAPKSEAAEAWDAIKNTTNQALLQAFITRYADTFFAEIAKARLGELRTNAANPFPDVARKPVPVLPTGPAPALPPTDGVHERSVLYEEDPTNQVGRQAFGTVEWRAETIKAEGKPDEGAIRADVDIPSRNLKVTLTIKRNLDPKLPATHVFELKSRVSPDFENGEIANIPGILMKTDVRAKGTPFAGLSVKVTDGFFLFGLSNVAADDQTRNLTLLSEREWMDIPMVYANHRRAILAIDKGKIGDRVIKTVLTGWGQYPAATASPHDQ